jgi:hypothetical protein
VTIAAPYQDEDELDFGVVKPTIVQAPSSGSAKKVRSLVCQWETAKPNVTDFDMLSFASLSLQGQLEFIRASEVYVRDTKSYSC